jgi:hypothetical protein
MAFPTRALAQAWDRYWFRPGSLKDLALMRVVLVAFQLAWMALANFESRLDARAAVDSTTADPPFILTCVSWPLGGPGAIDSATVGYVLAAGWISGVLSLVGAFTRTSLALFAWTQVVLIAWIYSGCRLQHPEALMAIALCSLALAPSGARWSLDSRLRSGAHPCDRSAQAAWPLLLVRWMLAFAYLSAAWSKLVTGGWDWVNGYTLQYFTFVKAKALGLGTGIWISEQHEVATLLSMATILFEGLFFVVLVAPRLAAYFVFAGALLHAGIWMTIGAPFFQFVALYVVFWPEIAKRRNRPLAVTTPERNAVVCRLLAQRHFLGARAERDAL